MHPKGVAVGRSDRKHLTVTGQLDAVPKFFTPVSAFYYCGVLRPLLVAEQAIGKEADGRTDIYSLGCTAYWALTGSTVFKGATPMETVMMHVNQPPEPPSSRAKQVIPPDLDECVLACLEKDPADRPEDADEVASMLAACDLGEPWDQQLARHWWEANMPAPARTEIRRSGSMPQRLQV